MSIANCEHPKLQMNLFFIKSLQHFFILLGENECLNGYVVSVYVAGRK